MDEHSGSALAAPKADSLPWDRRYAHRLTLTDFLVITWAVVGAQIARFGLNSSNSVVPRNESNWSFTYTILSMSLIVGWMVVLATFGTRDSRVVGTGSAEYKKIIDACLRLFGVVAIVAFLLKVDVARSYILLAFPIGLFALITSRWLWRQWLASKRQHGLFSDRVILIGSLETVQSIAADLEGLPSAGYFVVGACVVGQNDLTHLPRKATPVSSDFSQVVNQMRELDADTVIITSSDHLPAARVRELSWSLDPGRHHLVVAPSLADIGGPRIHIRPVAGLPLVHVEMPRFEGAKALSKRFFDIVVTMLLLVVLSPVMLTVAMCMWLFSNGPVFYQSERIGMKGKPFRMYKFRSMRAGADAELATLLAAQGTNGTPLFKITDDPRITPLGAILRKYSLDELPQLLNVLGGSMSLVGPRPQVAAEVALYDDTARRRLLFKPGVSGLWQVSGRSNLSWEDAIRLDLYYVENWSLTGDLLILSKTLRAVLGNDGAV